ncbi:Major intracellular serine protease [Fusarium oxysporum f. sp. cubense race 1]|uniref:Major intracellular serine protease n=1 Tax=Fusarium oxysporum f. sp. cubense (strain race 1) TaxID=1229664 RepID=N4UK15_FUSC1|nr:Major intracellular serine protease [Fusarium oxysporum f. sp. cubense race 1]
MNHSDEASNGFSQAHEEDDDEVYLDEDEFPAASVTLLDEDPVKAKFERHVEEARILSNNLQNSESSDKASQQLKFVNDRFSEWHNTTEEGKNFLHFLADYDHRIHKPPVNLQWLMWRAIRKLPAHLLWSPDHNKRIPLTSALLANNSLFGWSVCLKIKDATCQEYNALLQKRYENWDESSETTCLHAAAACIFDNGVKRTEFFGKVCGFAPRDMFFVRDTKRRTPLHRAVDYECCCNSQVEVVKEILRSCPDLLDETIQDPDDFNRTLSVYQYHHHTRKKFLESRRRRAQDLAIQEPPAVVPKRVEHKQERGVDPKKDAKRVITRTEKSGSEKTSMVPPPGVKRRRSIAATPQGATTPVQSPSLRPITRVKTGTATRPDVVQKPGSKEKEMEDAARTISNLLKLETLRKLSPEKAADSLRLRDDPDKEFWFDFGPPNTVSQDDFKKYFGHLQFDTALHDEAIEQCLEDFGVEILDWRRLDLDALTLRKIGTHLREVHLQWSGSNSTLRAWSEEEGLASIPTLEVIHLFQHEGLESRERTIENLNAFEQRLHESWPEGRPKPQVIPPKTGGGVRMAQVQVPDARPQPLQRSIYPHKWMECMTNFSKRFKQIKALRGNNPSLPPVEVTLIDDGVDIMHPDLNDTRDRTFLGQSFDLHNGGSTPRVPPYWSSPSGHGTLMARLIHKICPSAIIHVIKLQTFWSGNSKKLQIKPDSAVKAINYAANRGSQIICMSWAIKPPEEPLRSQFDTAIFNAIGKHGVLIFCAASDQGQSADVSYPHASSHHCFRIGAAKATGSIVDTVGDSQTVDLIFPGHEVVIDSNETKTQLEKFDAHSGSSVANGLAAGLAALVIECVRLGALYTREYRKLEPKVAINYSHISIDEEDLKKIRSRAQMAYALNWIGTNQNTNNKYIEVWHTFSGVAEKLSRSEGVSLEQLEHIATLAGFFLKKGM